MSRKRTKRTAKKSTLRQSGDAVKYTLVFNQAQLWAGRFYREGERLQITKSLAEAIKGRKDLSIIES